MKASGVCKLSCWEPVITRHILHPQRTIQISEKISRMFLIDLYLPFLPLQFYHTSNMRKDEASVINVDPNGDAILEVSCPDGKTHLLVSSKVLTLASP